MRMLSPLVTLQKTILHILQLAKFQMMMSFPMNPTMTVMLSQKCEREFEVESGITGSSAILNVSLLCGDISEFQRHAAELLSTISSDQKTIDIFDGIVERKRKLPNGRKGPKHQVIWLSFIKLLIN